MKNFWELVERGFTVLSLMLYTGGILTVVISGGYSEGETDDLASDNALIKQIFLLIYFITFLLLLSHWERLVYIITKEKYILLLTVFIIASIIWSYSPSRTITRSVAILGTNLFGLYLAIRYTLKQQIILLVWTFATIIFLSLLFAVILPKYGIMGGFHAGALRGIYNHKNVLGKMMVMSTSVFWLQAISSNKNRLLMYFGFGWSIILLLLAKSSSALVNLPVVISIFFALRTWRWRYEVMIPTLVAIIMLIFGFVIWFNEYSDLIFSTLGKDSTLTGRTSLWLLVWDMIWKKPWLGYGYGAFWWGFQSASAEIWYASGWNPPNSHNGFLDLWLSVGILGLSIFLISFLKTLYKCFILLRYSKTYEEFWPLVFLVYLLLSNLTETALMLQNDIFTVLYVAIAYSVISIHYKDKQTA